MNPKNHPWRTRNSYFQCVPNCADRKPGCQDHCKRHAESRRKYDADREAAKLEELVDRYVIDTIDKNRNASAIRDKERSMYRKRRSGD